MFPVETKGTNSDERELTDSEKLDYLTQTAMRLNLVLDQVEALLPQLSSMGEKLSKNPLLGGLFK